MTYPLANPLIALLPVGSHTSAGVASSTTLTAPAGSSAILLQATAENIRFTLDGTTPTASTGFQLRAGDAPLLVMLLNVTALKFIEETATAALQYQWLG